MKRYKKVYVEITNVCNLKCDFCPETHRTAQFMSEVTFRHILQQIAPFTEYIYLHVKGEPLLHPELSKLLDISEEQNFKVNITTNGTLIAEVAEMLLAKPAVRQINFSLHSVDGNPAGIMQDSYSDGILAFVMRAMAETKIIISLRLWNLDASAVPGQQESKNGEILGKLESFFELSYNLEQQLAVKNAVKLGERVYLNQDYEFAWPDLKAEEDGSPGFCYGLKNQIAILVDGTVVPCCLDGEGVINLGNIHEQAFAEIINAERAETIRLAFANQHVIEEFCRKCGYRKRFSPL